MANVKGFSYNNLCTYIVEHEGPAALEDLKKSMPAQWQGLMGRKIDNDEWIDVFAYYTLFRKYIDAHHGGDVRKAMLPSQYSVKRNMTTLHKVFFKFGNIGFVIKMATFLFRKYFDEGSIKILKNEAGLVTGELVDFPVKDAVSCYSAMGGMMGGLEASGGKNVRADHSMCIHSGGTRCYFEFRYDK